MPHLDPSVGWVRLLVRLTEPDDNARLAAAVADVLGPTDQIGQPWLAEPLFPGATAAELRRCRVVSGAVPAQPGSDPARLAFDLAAGLADELDVEVQPDLPSAAYGPEPGESDLRTLAPGDHLPGSDRPTWAVEAVRAPEAWHLDPPPGGFAKGRGVLVGHIDTGYTDHPELAGTWNLHLDSDIVDGDDDARDPLQRRWYMPLDSPGHGTHTAGVIASPESQVIVGAAPAATVVPFRAVRSVVQVLDGHVARAVYEAHRSGCQVITMSLGGVGFFGLRAAIQAATGGGAIVMAAAGNQVGVVVAPAVYPECIAVAASNVQDRPWSGSSRGSMVDVSAPGESVWVAAVDSSVRPPRFHHDRHHGTSFAVATLAGVAALWIAHHGYGRIVERVGLSNVQAAFLALLRSHGHRVPPGWSENGWDRLYGAGVVDAHALLTAPLPDPVRLVPQAGLEDFDTVARLRGVLTDLDRNGVRGAISALLEIADEQVDELPAGIVAELVFRISENPSLRAALAGADTPGSTSPAAPMDRARSDLRAVASQSLVGLLG
jgi:subtilisin family serine protease